MIWIENETKKNNGKLGDYNPLLNKSYPYDIQG